MSLVPRQGGGPRATPAVNSLTVRSSAVCEQQMSREEIRAQFGVRYVYRWELDSPAQEEFAGLPPAARVSLAAFMDAVVIVDPVHYHRRPRGRGQRP